VGGADSIRAELYRVAGQLKLSSLTAEIIQAAAPTNPNLTTRLAATEALAMLDPERAIAPLTNLLADADVPTAARQQAAQQLGRIDRPDARNALLAQLKTAPEPVAIFIAASVAGTRESAAALLKEIDEGRSSAELLREPTVVDRLKSSASPMSKGRLTR
jgi:HEAT repeat protein